MVALRIIWAFLIKDTLQILRNSKVMVLLLFYPVFSIFVASHIFTYQNDNLNVAYVDNDNSQLSAMIIDALCFMGDETQVVKCSTYSEARSLCDNDIVESVLEIPQGYEKTLLTTGKIPSISLSINATEPVKAMLGSYKILGNIGQTIAKSASMYGLVISARESNVVVTNFYNPSLNYLLYMLPVAFLAILLSLCVNVTGVSISDERSSGGMDLINASPVSRTILILSKILSCFVFAIFDILVSFLLIMVVYGCTPTGSILLLFLSLSVFVFGISATVLLISNFSRNTSQTLMISGLYTITAQLMSGYLTPIESMHRSIQIFSYLNPCRYFVEILRNVYLKSAVFSDLYPQFLWLSTLSVFTCVLAVITYKKRIV